MNIYLSNTTYVSAITGFAFLLTLFLLPKIRKSSLKFGLHDAPNHRSSHSQIVPTLGGLSFFVCLMITLLLAQRYDTNNVGLTLLVSITIVFFTGLMDDLRDISPKMKFLGQIIGVGVLMIQSDFRIESFHGFLGLHELPILISLILSMFFILSLINAFNLIDGIDGLASIIGIVIASSYAFLFYKLGMLLYLVISLSVMSSLFAFLRFNFSPRKKIFMGDTGSLVIGLVLGLLTLKLLSLGTNAFHVLAFDSSHLPLLILGILFIPVFDIFRVMAIRIKRKKPVFSPDRNHVHHILIDAGMSHLKASLFCGIGNIVIVLIMFYSIREFGLLASLFILLFFTSVFLLLIFGLNKSIQTKRKKVKLREKLFSFSHFRKSKNRASVNARRLSFNQKLKSIRILFF